MAGLAAVLGGHGPFTHGYPSRNMQSLFPVRLPASPPAVTSGQIRNQVSALGINPLVNGFRTHSRQLRLCSPQPTAYELWRPPPFQPMPDFLAQPGILQSRTPMTQAQALVGLALGRSRKIPRLVRTAITP